jgi:chromosome segregation ATPase
MSAQPSWRAWFHIDTVPIMSSRDELQMQLSQVLSTVESQGYKMEDVIPEEMQDHFQDMTALKEARQYIKDADAREKDLQVEINDLLAKLEVKQAEIDDQPEEFKALVVDLQQEKRSVDYYKGLADDSQARAERYQRKLADAAKQQTATDEANQTIQRLRAELEDQRAITVKLSQEYRTNDKIAEAKDALIAEKEVNMTTILTYTHQLEKEKLQLEQDIVELKEMFKHEKRTLEAAMVDTEQVSAACENLIETLEQETHSVTNAVNRKSFINDAF